MWQKSYPPAEIHTIENFYYGGCVSKKALEQEGFIVHEGNQKDVKFLETIGKKFDLIVEDGSHLVADQQITFIQLFKNNLNPGGLYVIEDVYSDNKHFWHGDVDDIKDTPLGAFTEFANNHKFISKFFEGEDPQEWANIINSINFYINNEIIFISKK